MGILWYTDVMKVLVIDDEKFIRNVFASELAQENIDVATASDGEEGLVKAKEWHPDVIVLDMILPKRDGFELLELFRKMPELKGVAVYAFSELAQEHDKTEAMELGAIEYFSKDQHTVRQVVDAIRARSAGVK